MKQAVFLSLIVLIVLMGTIGSMHAADLGRLGIEIISSSVENGRTVCEAKDADGNEFSFVSEGALSDSQAEILAAKKNTFYSWKYLNISYMTITFSDSTIEINIIPESFEYGGIDFTEYIPSGIQFYWDTYAEYDFRMRVKGLFLRIKGQLFTEEELCKTLLGAVRNPAAYLRARDPGYLSRQLEEINKEIEKTREQYSAIIKPLDTLKGDYEGLKQDYAGLKEDHAALKQDCISHREDYTALRQDHDTLRQDYATLRQDHDTFKQESPALKDSHAALLSDFQLLRHAVLVLHNRGFLGSVEIMKKKGIDRILVLKKENPDLRQKDVTALLAKDNISMSMNEIFLIFSVYFNEFE